jgi:hypothetical protein
MERLRICFLTIYSCELRFIEGTHLNISDIDCGQMVLHLKKAKCYRVGCWVGAAITRRFHRACAIIDKIRLDEAARPCSCGHSIISISI